MWYLTNVASKFDLELEQVARQSLQKSKCPVGTSGRIFAVGNTGHCFDDGYPEAERLPRRFIVTIRDDGSGVVDTFRDGVRLGNRLSDNHYIDDGYRYHDVFHFAICSRSWAGHR